MAGELYLRGKLVDDNSAYECDMSVLSRGVRQHLQEQDLRMAFAEKKYFSVTKAYKDGEYYLFRSKDLVRVTRKDRKPLKDIEAKEIDTIIYDIIESKEDDIVNGSLD